MDERGFIPVDEHQRTNVPHIYAIGDVINGPRFTHISNYHAGLVIRNALFRLPVRTDHLSIPWVTFTDPELAHVGLTEAGAKRRASIHLVGAATGLAEFERGGLEVLDTDEEIAGCVLA